MTTGARMIEPLRSGRRLSTRSGATEPRAGSVAVWWLGQSGFLLKSAGVTLVVDPYLSEHLTHEVRGDRPAPRPDDPGPFRGAT